MSIITISNDNNEPHVGGMVTFTMGPFLVGDVATDPTKVYLEIRKPNAATATRYEYSVDPEIIRDSVGNYHADIELDVAGRWYFDIEGTGTCIVSQGDWFYVHPKATA